MSKEEVYKEFRDLDVDDQVFLVMQELIHMEVNSYMEEYESFSVFYDEIIDIFEKYCAKSLLDKAEQNFNYEVRELTRKCLNITT